MVSPKYSKRNTRRVNALRPRQNGRHFADDTFNRIFVNENVRISIEFSLKFVPKGPSNNIPALVQIMAWRRPGDKPLSEPVMVSLLAHICFTLPQWVNLRLWLSILIAAFLFRNTSARFGNQSEYLTCGPMVHVDFFSKVTLSTFQFWLQKARWLWCTPTSIKFVKHLSYRHFSKCGSVFKTIIWKVRAMPN